MKRLDLMLPAPDRNTKYLLYNGEVRQEYDAQGKPIHSLKNGGLEHRYIFKVDHTKMEYLPVLPVWLDTKRRK